MCVCVCVFVVVVVVIDDVVVVDFFKGGSLRRKINTFSNGMTIHVVSTL